MTGKKTVAATLAACVAALTVILTVCFTSIAAADPKKSASAEDMLTVSSTVGFARKNMSLQPAERYIFSAKVKRNAAADGSAWYGVSAGADNASQNMDFLISGRGELSSYASMYDNTRRYDLGYRRVYSGDLAANVDHVFTVVRAGKLFYFLAEGELKQIREFEMLPSVPGVTANKCAAEIDVIEYNADPDAVDAFVDELMSARAGYSVANGWANFAGMQTEKDRLVFSDPLRENIFEYSRMAFDGSYSKDLTVEYTTANLSVAATAETTDKWPKLALLIYYEDHFEDMLCLGVAKKQDRVETFMYNEPTQWFNHTDFTGDTSSTSVIDKTGDLHFRVEIKNNISFKAFRVYVDDVLYAVRTSTANGPIRLGFACEYVSGEIKDFKVTEK